MRLKSGILSCALLCGVDAAHAEGSLLRGFAASVAAATIAEDRCPKMQEDIMGQAKIWSDLTQKGYTAANLRVEIKREQESMLAAFKKTGAKGWCRSAWEVFGPDGLKTIKGD